MRCCLQIRSRSRLCPTTGTTGPAPQPPCPRLDGIVYPGQASTTAHEAPHLLQRNAVRAVRGPQSVCHTEPSGLELFRNQHVPCSPSKDHSQLEGPLKDLPGPLTP